MRNLMIRVQDRAREIRSLQEEVPKLKAQLAETKGIFKGKERRALETQIQQTETKISALRDYIYVTKENTLQNFALQGAFQSELRK